MNTEWKSEKKIEINPSWAIQTVIGILIAIIGVQTNAQFSDMREQIREQSVQVAQLRADFTALEIGLRGDRFSRTDWEREKSLLYREIEKIEKEIWDMQSK